MTEIKKQFATLVIYYRKMVMGWSQEELATKSFLPKRTISDIENAKKAVLDHETVFKLASAFELSGKSWEEFFQAAGLSMSESEKLNYEWLQISRNFYRDTNYPAFSVDSLFELKSINSYLLALQENDENTLFEAMTHPLGLNVLRYFFDPFFRAKELYRTHWLYYTKLNLWVFRNISRPYSHTEDYRRLLTNLQQFNNFQTIWEELENFEPEQPPFTITIHTKLFGKAHYMHSEIFLPKYDFERLLFYTPADTECGQIFEEIRSQVPRAAYRIDKRARQAISRIL